MYKNLLIIAGLLSTICSCTKDKGKVPEVVVADTCSVNIKYSTQIKHIVDTHCAVSGCHDGGSGGNGVNFTNYNGLKSSVDNSTIANRVKTRINSTGTDIMPPSGSGQSIDACEKSKINAWIEDGALNN